jgi:DNA repair exonuclease SbcCD ATPase subunit
MEREKTRGELIAEKLEKEADEMMKQIQDSQTESEPEAKGLATEEAEETDTPEEVVEDVEASPDESQETEESSDQSIEEVQEEETKSDKGLLSADQWEERYKNAQARMTKATQREKELEAKIAEMNNKITAMESMKSETRIEQQKEEVNVDLGEIMKDYPEIVKPLQKYVDARISAVDNKVNQATEEVLKAQKEEADRKHYAAIADVHPDWKSVSGSDDFAIWLERQSRMWRNAASEGDAQDVVALLSKYKNDLGLVSKKVSKEELVEKAKQNVEPSLSKARKQNVGSSKRIWTAQEIGRLSDKEYRKLEKEIDQAYAEGRVKPK